MPIWRQPNGKIYRNPATCNVVNCDTPPCGQQTECCAETIPNTLTGSYSGGDFSLVWDEADSQWEGTFTDSSCGSPTEYVVHLSCVLGSWGVVVVGWGSASATDPICDPLLLVFEGIVIGCATIDITVTA